MGCDVIDLGNGAAAFVCGRGRQRQCATPGCHRRAPLLCDWKIGAKRDRTCDRPMCPDHAFQPDPDQDKHLCPPHKRAYQRWVGEHGPASGTGDGGGS